MSEFDPKIRDLESFHRLDNSGKINLQPDYQRGRVWNNKMRLYLIDSVLNNLPIGIIMINIITDPETGDKKLDIVDGQQRLTTLFEYLKTNPRDLNKPEWLNEKVLRDWAKKNPEIKYFADLPEPRQDDIRRYPLAIGELKGFEEEEINDIYSRLQESKPLKIGERIKAMKGPYMNFIKSLADHRIFAISGGIHRQRYNNFNLAASFYKAVYNSNPFERIELQYLKDFIIDANKKYKEIRAKNTEQETRKLLNYTRKVILEAIEQDQLFENQLKKQKILKWIFAAIYFLRIGFVTTGRETVIANGVLKYFENRDKDETQENILYLKAGRTGRIDTDDVKVCLNNLVDTVINTAELEPLDEKRYFSKILRDKIFAKSLGKCAMCGIRISKTNFHADHVKPFSEAGPTTLENGQALCVKCNIEKGKNLFIPIFNR